MANPPKGEPRYQVPRELADSLAYRSLPSASKLLWHDLMMQYRGNNNGNINAALSELRRYGWKSPTTLTKGLLHLIAHGLIKETRMGGNRAGDLKKCCLYGFTHLPIHANSIIGIKGAEPSFAYRDYNPKTNIAAETLTLQKMECDAPHSEACRSNKCTQEPSITSHSGV